MELFRPWQTSIARINVAELCDLDQLTQEILIVSAGGTVAVPQDATRDDPFVGGIVTLRDDVITPRVMEYIRTEYGLNCDPETVAMETWGMNIAPGSDLETHIHGLSNFTTVFYPCESDARLVLVDPRLNAARGFSKSLRDRNFGNLRVDPKPGDLWIFPSFVPHSVTSVGNEFRLSLVNDYFLDPTLD
jgi:hypothetical protein